MVQQCIYVNENSSKPFYYEVKIIRFSLFSTKITIPMNNEGKILI